MEGERNEWKGGEVSNMKGPVIKEEEVKFEIDVKEKEEKNELKERKDKDEEQEKGND